MNSSAPSTNRACVPLAIACLLLGACASTDSSSRQSPSLGLTAAAQPGVPVRVPQLEDQVQKERARPAPITDARRRVAKPRQVRRAQPALSQAFWLDDAPEGRRRVIISIAHQTAQVWVGDVLIGQSPVSTGREGYHTPPGQYSIIEKRREHRSSLYGEFINAEGKHVGLARAGQKAPPGTRYVASPMPYFMRMTWSGIGMHEGYIPGWPASHGCIRLPRVMAERFFAELPKGTPVEIIP